MTADVRVHGPADARQGAELNGTSRASVQKRPLALLYCQSVFARDAGCKIQLGLQEVGCTGIVFLKICFSLCVTLWMVGRVSLNISVPVCEQGIVRVVQYKNGFGHIW